MTLLQKITECVQVSYKTGERTELIENDIHIGLSPKVGMYIETFIAKANKIQNVSYQISEPSSGLIEFISNDIYNRLEDIPNLFLYTATYASVLRKPTHLPESFIVAKKNDNVFTNYDFVKAFELQGVENIIVKSNTVKEGEYVVGIKIAPESDSYYVYTFNKIKNISLI
jgi:hypothetical protein